MHRFAVTLSLAMALPLFADAATSTGTKTLGSAVSPIVIEVFSDYQCPACKGLYLNTLRPLINEYVNAKKKVFLVHREYPLPMHAYARAAACYACAAERIGKYEEVGDALFQKQELWSKDGNIDGALSGVLSPAEVQKVRLLSKDPGVVAEVNREVDMGLKKNVMQTPTMLITYKGQQFPVAGGVSYPILRRFLDELLSK